MTDAIDPASDRAGITADGIGAVIPAALIAAILNRQSGPSGEAVTVDARALRVAVAPETLATMLNALQPDREIAVTLEAGAIRVAAAGLPPIRVEIPPDGLRLTVDPTGIHLGGE